MNGRPNDLAMFHQSYSRDAETGCWNWTRRLTASGYGQFRQTTAQRASYQFLRGPIADGLHVDHLCRNRGCVNPDHLELVTPRENIDRAVASRLVCRNGHPRTPENTRMWVTKGVRGPHCRICKCEASLRGYYRSLGVSNASTALRLKPSGLKQKLNQGLDSERG